jgi:hypothetical protein
MCCSRVSVTHKIDTFDVLNIFALDCLVLPLVVVEDTAIGTCNLVVKNVLKPIGWWRHPANKYHFLICILEI